MHLKTLKLLNFKNYKELSFSPKPGINCIIGSNGSGKTNLLDAIHYLSMTKSAFNSADTQNIRHESEYFSIIGNVKNSDGNYDIQCSLKKGSKKILRCDNNEYDKLSEHIGRFPCILITPNDVEIIQGGNEIRRKFFDAIISQNDQNYLQDLIAYNHNLKQRNGLLKYFRHNLVTDHDLIEPYNHVLIEKGLKIYKKRKSFLDSFYPIFLEKYAFIAAGNELCELSYITQFIEEDLLEKVNDSLAGDIELQRTTIGIHRDQWKFTMGGRDLKRIGSQGQQKTYLISLKTAQFDLIKKEKGFPPILLLDDIFDKLDDHRIHQLMHLIANENHGQLFLTDARPERTKSILKTLNLKGSILVIENGKKVSK